MGLLDNIRFNYVDSLGIVASKIEKWRPRRCKTEKDYEKSLYMHLHKELPGIQVTKQFARGRVRADLMIGDKVLVEIKRNLNTTAKYQRLIGQIADHKEWAGSGIILLIGETEPNLRKQLDKYLHDEGLSDDFAIGDVRVS
jgi:hypothetical protein